MEKEFKTALEKAITLLKEMISTPSISREEDNCADIIERHIQENGYIAGRHLNNVWTIAPGFDNNRPTILLNSHIDTVKPVSGWTLDPYTPLEKDNKIYGLGSNDAGASVVSLLQVFFLMSSSNQSYNLIFAASAEEEVSGKNGMETLLKELPKIDFAIIGEPTEMELAVAEKGLMVIDCTAKGKAGHAARNEGKNAIYKALDDIKWFKTYQFKKKSEFLDEVKMTVTQINAGTQHNVVPDRCKFVVDIRSNECYTNQEIIEKIRKHVNSKVEPRSMRLNSSNIQLDHPFVKKAEQLGRKKFGSPTLSDQALLSFPSIKMGPGKSSRSHTANEYIKIDEIDKAIRLYFNLLDGFKL